MTEEELVAKWEHLTRHLTDDDGMKRIVRQPNAGEAVTPRPIYDIPHEVMLAFDKRDGWEIRRFSDDEDADGYTHFIPLSSLPKPGGE